MVRTRNCKVRNERIETGVLVKSQKGKNVSVERRTEGQCSKRRSLQFPPRRQSVWKDTTIVFSCSEIAEEDLRKQTLPGEVFHPERSVKKHTIITSKKIVRIRRVIFVISPYVKIASLSSQNSKKQVESGRKGSVALFEESRRNPT